VIITYAVASTVIVVPHWITVEMVAKASGVASIVTSALFDQILQQRNDVDSPAKGFYMYDAFIAAANSFSGFGTAGNTDTPKREIAAFLAQTSNETTGMFS
jgi:basic endochitinase B